MLTRFCELDNQFACWILIIDLNDIIDICLPDNSAIERLVSSLVSSCKITWLGERCKAIPRRCRIYQEYLKALIQSMFSLNTLTMSPLLHQGAFKKDAPQYYSSKIFALVTIFAQFEYLEKLIPSTSKWKTVMMSLSFDLMAWGKQYQGYFFTEYIRISGYFAVLE